MAARPRFTTEESRWNALVQRDRAAEGAFYYGVRSTGVFCRPGCSSRLPRHENVEFFNDCKSAELAGYRACKRCKPGGDSPQERLAQRIVQACRRLEQAEFSPSLEELAAEAGLSREHFHRLFKKFVGVTPKQYAATRRNQRFRNRLKSAGSVTEAIYDAGFGSSSRVYEKRPQRFGMTPSAYRKGATGLTIRYGIASCFLGWVVVAATDRGICAIEFGDDPSSFSAQLQKIFPKAQLEEAGPDFSAVIEKVIAFIEAPGKRFELPLDIRGTAFQQRVWSALCQIAPGSTASYVDIACRIGSPEAARAVGHACAANKLAVAVPCHRVVRGDGKLSGYRWGVERKRTLLLRESGDSKNDAPVQKENTVPPGRQLAGHTSRKRVSSDNQSDPIKE